MASAKIAGLIEKGDAQGLQELVENVTQQDAARLQIQRRLVEHHQGLDDISLPPSLLNPMKVHSYMVRAQHDMAFGILDNPPRVRIGTASARKDAQDAAQERENAANALYPFLEARNGAPIWSRTLMDVIMFGFGVDSIRGFPQRVSSKNGMPLRSGFEAGDSGTSAYESARQHRLRTLAVGREGFPLEWHWCPAQSFYFRENPESPNGLGLTIEIKTRLLKDVLESERYAKSLPLLREKFNKLLDENKSGALTARVRFVIVEDRFTCSYLVLPESPDTSAASNQIVPTSTALQSVTTSSSVSATSAQLAAQQWLWESYKQAELADQFPNPIGYPQYVVTRGMFSNVDAPQLQYRGFCYGMLDLEEAINAIISWRLTRTKRESFPAWIATTQLQIVDGRPYDPSAGVGDEETEIKLNPGADTATRLRPGETLQPVLNTGGGPNEEWSYRELQRLLEMHGVPSTLLDARGLQSGYMMESLAQTVFSRAQPIIEGVRTAVVPRWHLTKDVLRALKIYVDIPGAIDKKSRQASFLRLDPAGFDDLEVVEGLYELKRKQNTAQDIANANNAVAGRMMTMEDAAEQFLGQDDWDKIREWWTIYDWEQTPEVKKWKTDKALEMAGISLDQAQADQAGAFSLSRILNGDPTLMARIKDKALPGTPAYQYLQRLPPDLGVGNPGQNGVPGDQTMGPGQPPNPAGVPSPFPSAQQMLAGPSQNGQPPNPVIAPRPPGRPVRTGGRPAGAAGGIPSGPHRSGAGLG